MARARYFEVATDTLGRPVPSATVNVYQPGTTTAITETIYAADTGATTLTNPITANAQGEIEFYLAAPKRVDLRWVKTGYTTESHPADVIGADLFVAATEKAAANGVATLDGSGLVPIAQLPGGAALDAEVTAAVAAHAVSGAAHSGTYVPETTAWIAPTLLNSWANFGSGFEEVGYKRVGGIVVIRGFITGGASGAVVFNLPAGYRPLGNTWRPAWGESANAKVEIGANGNVVAVVTGYIDISTTVGAA